MSLIDDSKFKKIHDTRRISSLLLTTKEKQHTVYVWRIIGDKKILAEVQFDLVLSARCELRLVPRPEAREDFNHVLGSTTTINFFIPHSSTLFQATVKGHHGDYGIVVSFPDFVAQMERRRWLRMEGENQTRLRVQFTKKAGQPRVMNQFFSKAVSDLSAGGLSFIATKQELRFLTEGEHLKAVEVLVEGKKIKVDAKVTRLQETAVRPYALGAKIYKVGLSFESIDGKEQDVLAKFIFQNMAIKPEAV